MNRILITVEAGAVVDVATDIPDVAIYLRDRDVIRERPGLYHGDAVQLDATVLAPGNLDVLLLAGELPPSRMPTIVTLTGR